jgi:hypothetical protein
VAAKIIRLFYCFEHARRVLGVCSECVRSAGVGSTVIRLSPAAFAGAGRVFTDSVNAANACAVSSSGHERPGESMSKHEVMWTTAGAAGVVSALAAGLAVWLFLTNPAAVTAAGSGSDAVGLIHVVASAMFNMAAHVLRYL